MRYIIALAVAAVVAVVLISCAPNHHTAWPTSPAPADTIYVPAPPDTCPSHHGGDDDRANLPKIQ